MRVAGVPGEGGRRAAFPFFILGLLLLALSPSCGRPPAPARADALRLQGPTMGTSWSASLHGAGPERDWQALLQAELDAIEAELTTWDPESELMRFNAWRPDELPGYFPAGLHFRACFALALRLHWATNRAFDPSVQPLVELWGFGAEREQPLPTEAQIRAARAASQLLALPDGQATPPGHIPKAVAGLALDFSACAKGYAADWLAARAAEAGCSGGLIEVGGEIRVFGARTGGGAWRVGIEQPAASPGAPKAIGSVLALEPGANLQAVATSGDTRNRRTIGELSFSHILDPRNGRPVQDPPAAVTVVAPDCATADAWATALLVLGAEEGLPLAREAGLEVSFQLRHTDGSLRERTTAGYPALVVERLTD